MSDVATPKSRAALRIARKRRTGLKGLTSPDRGSTHQGFPEAPGRNRPSGPARGQARNGSSSDDDVLVEAEQVLRIPALLQRHQPRVFLLAVGRPQPVAFVGLDEVR